MADTEKSTAKEKRIFIGAHVRPNVAKAIKHEAIDDGVTMQKWVETVLVRELETRNISQA